MAMTYTTLLAPKGTSGSIANWVGYSKLDLPVILDEAQSILYNILRVREMKTEWTFGVIPGQSSLSVPDRYLDPLGPLFDITNGRRVDHITDMMERRAYESVTGSLGSNPFLLTAGSTQVLVTDVAHGLSGGSTVTFANGTAVDVFNPNDTYPVIYISDADHFIINTDTEATTNVTGGGSGVTWRADRLILGVPSVFTIFGTSLRFDLAHDLACTYKHHYYRKPKLLSATNLNNWLTDRYPKLLRVACMAASADFMQDQSEYQKHMQVLTALIDSTVTLDDLSYRGASFGTDTP